MGRDAQPAEGEKNTFQDVNKVLQNSHQILEDLQCYKGADKEIREAIAAPNEETQSNAWAAVMPLVTKLKAFYQFSTQLDNVMPKILYELCSGDMSPTQHLETQQALVKQSAEILEYILKFDELKMKTLNSVEVSLDRASLNHTLEHISRTSDVIGRCETAPSSGELILRPLFQQEHWRIIEEKQLPIRKDVEKDKMNDWLQNFFYV